MRKDIDMAFGRNRIVRQPGETDQSLQERIDRAKKREIDRQEEIDDAKHERTLAEEEKKTADARKGLEVPAAGAGIPGFQFKGSFDMGEFNWQKMMADADARQAALLEQMRNEKEAGREVTDSLREQLHQAQMDKLEASFRQESAVLKDTLARIMASNVPIEKQVENIQSTAQALGLTVAKGGASETVSLELRQMEMNHELLIEEIKERREQAGREWTLKLEEFEDERDKRKAELAAVENRNAMLANAFPQIGAALAAGLMNPAGNPFTARDTVEEEPPAENMPRRYSKRIETGRGESGSIPCPDCEEPVIVGPTAEKAVCAECGLEIPIKRVKEPSQPEE